MYLKVVMYLCTRRSGSIQYFDSNLHDYLAVLQTVGRLLTYIRKRRGSRMLPWGTPTETICWVDWQFSTDVTRYWLWTYEANHLTTWELAPMVLSFLTRSTWSTVSKAFERSKKTAPVKPPLSRLCSMLSVKWARAVTVESLGQKRNWLGVSNSFADKNSYICWRTAHSNILLMVESAVRGLNCEKSAIYFNPGWFDVFSRQIWSMFIGNVVAHINCCTTATFAGSVMSHQSVTRNVLI